MTNPAATKPLTLKGFNGTIRFDGATITITRSGWAATAKIGKEQNASPSTKSPQSNTDRPVSSLTGSSGSPSPARSSTRASATKARTSRVTKTQ